MCAAKGGGLRLLQTLLKGGERLNIIRQHRTARGLTQQQLADICGVTRIHITNLETGEFRPSVDVAKKIGQALGFDWTEVFNDATADGKTGQ